MSKSKLIENKIIVAENLIHRFEIFHKIKLWLEKSQVLPFLTWKNEGVSRKNEKIYYDDTLL